MARPEKDLKDLKDLKDKKDKGSFKGHGFDALGSARGLFGPGVLRICP